MHACSRCRVEYTSPVGRCGLCGQPLANVADDPLLGATLGHYRIGGRLGSGSSGVVYRAAHVELQRDFAVKVLFGQHTANAKTAERFRREAHSLARLVHPNVVSVVDYGRARACVDGAAAEGSGELEYLVMELLGGETLRSALERGPLAPLQAANVLRQVAAGLAAAHAAGLVHRDLKPANIMLSRPEGHREVLAKILDFGLVALLDRGEDGADLTSDTVVLGTPAYMAPEQVHYSTVDERADLYSLGCTLHHMLRGEPPFSGERGDVLRGHAHRAPPPLLPAGGLETLAEWMMEKDPTNRAPDAAAVIEELDRILEGLGSLGSGGGPDAPRRPAPRAPRRRRTWPLALAVGAAAAGGIWSLSWATRAVPTDERAAATAPPSAEAHASTAKTSSAATEVHTATATRAEVAARPDPRDGDRPSAPQPRARAKPKLRGAEVAGVMRAGGEVAAPAEVRPDLAAIAEQRPDVAAIAEARAAEPTRAPIEATIAGPAAVAERPGWVNVVVTLGGRLRATAVRVDGVPVARRTPLKLELPAGTHVLEIAPAGAPPIQRSVEIKPASSTDVVFDL